MQCWQAPGRGALANGAARQRPGRGLALHVFSKLKYRANIAQNHNRKSVWVNIDIDRLLQQSSYNPGRQIGPLRLQQLSGRGRGLVAERDLPASELLLLCEPLGSALTGPEGEELREEQLARWLERLQADGVLGPADRARARLLYDGSPADSPSSLRNRTATLNDFRKLEDKLRRAAEAPKKPKGRGFGAPGAGGGGGAASGSAMAAAAGAASIDMAALGEAPLSSEEVTRLATYCSWGTALSDLAAAPVRQEPSQSIVGVWPEFSLLNHSCAPNTVAFNLGQLLLVKATRSIPQGTEVTTSYLDQLAQAPLERRREWLRGSYGFECGCERCQAEASLPAPVSAAVSAAYDLASSQEATDAMAAAVGRSDRGPLKPLEEQLGAAVARLEDQMAAAGLEEQLRGWLRNSAYPAYHTLASIRDLPEPRFGAGLFGGAGPQPFSDPEIPRQLAAIAQEVAAGTELHLNLVLETMTRAIDSLPRTDPRVVEATKDLLRAHILRYGAASDSVLWALIKARSQANVYLGRLTLGAQQSPLGGSGAVPLFGGPLGVSPAQLQQVAVQTAAEMAASAGPAASGV